MDDGEVRVMKGLILMALCALAGCVTGPSLEELEAQALVSGDWSLVEKREQQIERRKNREGPSCPVGYLAVCVHEIGSQRCECVDRSSFAMSLSFYR